MTDLEHEILADQVEREAAAAIARIVARAERPVSAARTFVRLAGEALVLQYSGIMAQTPQAPDPLSSGT